MTNEIKELCIQKKSKALIFYLHKSLQWDVKAWRKVSRIQKNSVGYIAIKCDKEGDMENWCWSVISNLKTDSKLILNAILKKTLTLDLFVLQNEKKEEEFKIHEYIPSVNVLPNIKDTLRCIKCGNKLDALQRKYCCDLCCSRVIKKHTREYKKQYKQENREEINKYHREYYHKNAEKIKNVQRERYKNNKEAIKKQKREYYRENREYHKQYNQINREEINRKNRIYYQKHKDEINQKKRQKRLKKKYSHINKDNLTKEILNKLYWDEKMSVPEIATLLEVHQQSIYYRMWKWGIPRRTDSERSKLVLEKNKDLMDRIKKVGEEGRKKAIELNTRIDEFDIEEIIRLYTEEYLSYYEIAEKLDNKISTQSIRLWLKERSTLRARGETRTLKWFKNNNIQLQQFIDFIEEGQHSDLIKKFNLSDEKITNLYQIALKYNK